MIIDFFIKLLNNLVDLLPSFKVDWFMYPVNSFFNVLSTLNYYFPVGELMVILGSICSFYVFRLLFRIIKWIASRIVI